MSLSSHLHEGDIPFDWDSVPIGIALPLSIGIAGNLSEVAAGPYPLQLLRAFFDHLVNSIIRRFFGPLWGELN
jgi:hypothetical protein